LLEELAFIIFFTCIFIYFILLFSSINTKKPSQRSVMNEIYRNWVSTRLKSNDPIVTVQALRNFIMADSTFISALFILLGLIVGIYDVFFNDFTPFWGLPSLPLGLIKMLVNIFIIIFALFNFIISIRMLNRLNILLTGNPQNFNTHDGKIKGEDIAKKTFMIAQNHWMFAIRSLLFLVATMVWFLSTFLFIITTLLVTIYLIVFQDLWLFSR